MHTIYKYTLKITDVQEIALPADARFLNVQNQKESVNLWVMLDTEAPTIQHEIRMVGTGHVVRRVCSMNYLGTVQTAGGALVWHVFQKLMISDGAL